MEGKCHLILFLNRYEYKRGCFIIIIFIMGVGQSSNVRFFFKYFEVIIPFKTFYVLVEGG